MAVRRMVPGWVYALTVGCVLFAMAGRANAQPPTKYLVDVSVDSIDDLHTLEAEGYLVSHVSPGHVELLIAPEELTDLAGRYPVTVIDIQPHPPTFSGEKALGVYPSFPNMTADLQQIAADNPDIVRLVSLGQSVQGRDLWAMLITDNPDVEEDEPEFKYVSTMHGDENVGTVMCMYLIDRLLSGYGNDSRITDLVNETAIWIVPLMNPDGWVLGTRTNANGYDLNRSFPEYPDTFVGTIFDGWPLFDTGRQPEVAHILRWSAENSFTLSANLHTGSVVVNYPYDYEPGFLSGQAAISPDELLFQSLSLTYSIHNLPMYSSGTFPNGITNGSAWFSITGGMQDWNYRYAGNFEVTIELAVPKKPSQGQLPTYWSQNEESMLSFMEAAQTGVRGIVRDRQTGAPVYAKITVAGNGQPVFTDPDVGDYHRLLLPGTYSLTVQALGFGTKTYNDIQVFSGPATRLDVFLENEANLPAAGTGALIALASTLIVATAAAVARRGRA